MSDAELLETQLATTPSGRSHSAGGEELPEDLLREATQRLGTVALVWAGLFVIGIVMNDFVAPLRSSQIFRATIIVLGNGIAELDDREVVIVVPAGSGPLI